jgi:hypothetical protein
MLGNWLWLVRLACFKWHFNCTENLLMPFIFLVIRWFLLSTGERCLSSKLFGSIMHEAKTMTRSIKILLIFHELQECLLVGTVSTKKFIYSPFPSWNNAIHYFKRNFSTVWAGCCAPQA